MDPRLSSAPLPIDYKKLLSARFLFVFAVQMQSVILGWRIYELVHDPLALGMIGLAEAIPAIGLALYAGYLVDRMRPLIVYRRLIYASLLSGFIVLSEHIFDSELSLPVQAGMLYGASFMTGVARAFSQPAMFASVPRLVSRAQLLRATALNSSTMQVARVAGPALGGLAFGFLGPVISSSMVCVFLAVAIGFMIFIKTDLPPPEQTVRHASIKEELLSGVRFVVKHPILFPAMSLDMISVFFGGVTALLPIFANDILHVGAQGLGVLRGAPAFGAAITSIYLSRHHAKARTGKAFLSSVLGFGVCILVFGLSRNYLLSVAALFFSGAFDSVSMIIRSTAVQLASPDYMRGKISAVNSIFVGSSNEIGEVESGVVAKLIGTVPAVYFGGLMCVLTVGLISWRFPILRKMDLNRFEETVP
jgi:MFS family permease